jgi:hydroxymethylglutaryl-CoA reductase (NADPH)
MTTNATNNHKVPEKNNYSNQAIEARQQWLSQKKNIDLSSLKTNDQVHRGELFQGNIENHIGFVQIPVGLAGPILIEGGYAQGEFFVPLATTEGALVASCSRGMAAITASGGARVRVLSDQMMRAPMFLFPSLLDAQVFSELVFEEQENLEKITKLTSKYARLKGVNPIILGDNVAVQLSFETGDAYGANMVMKSCWAITRHLKGVYKQKTGSAPLDAFVDSPLGAEKKVSSMSYATSLRGKRVVAEVNLTREAIASFLKTTPEDLFETLVAGMAPNMAACNLGFNVNFANVIAAIFTATGQDIATVPESCQGQINYRLTAEGLYFGVLLPNLIVATVGGGTALPSQATCLDILESKGSGKAMQLAEIVAVTCMALDLSTFAAIVADHFVDAHERLGRNRPRTGPLRLDT